jgi:hypothetical protein
MRVTTTALGIIAVAGGASAATRPSYPSVMLGRWGQSKEGCSPGAVHGGITVSQSAVRDGEFSGDIRAIRHRPDGSFVITESWDDEESPSTTVVSYKLSADRHRLTSRLLRPRRNDGYEVTTYIRCRVPR